MLLEVTKRCTSECKHCFVSATKDGPHMSTATVREFIEFHNALGSAPLKWLTDNPIPSRPKKIIISGGEPTEHPDLAYIVQDLVDGIEGAHIMLETNGTWVNDTAKVAAVERILDHDSVVLMVASAHRNLSTHYNRYMLDRDALLDIADRVPKQDTTALRMMGHPDPPEVSKLLVDADWLTPQQVIPLGRAIESGISKLETRPPCATLIEFAYECGSFVEFIVKLELQNRYSVPYINTYGDIFIGVGDMCIPLGNVKDRNFEDMHEVIKNALLCDKCGLVQNMSEKDLLTLEQLRKYKNLQ